MKHGNFEESAAVLTCQLSSPLLMVTNSVNFLSLLCMSMFPYCGIFKSRLVLKGKLASTAFLSRFLSSKAFGAAVSSTSTMSQYNMHIMLFAYLQ